ncbi:MAG: C4-dicarboxylate transporter DctA [Steroidobacteraceae bacterium]|jgi:aerobic C4-dicarboxylate transport protein
MMPQGRRQRAINNNSLVPRRSIIKSGASRFYLVVLCAIIAGVLLGLVWPAGGVALKPVGDAFIALIKMLIAPVIFFTVVLGIAGGAHASQVGRVALKAIAYFEVVSTFSLAIGLMIVNVLKPGNGFNVNPATLDAGAVAKYAQQARDQSAVDFLLHIIPKTFTDAFTNGGDLLQVLLLALLTGLALMSMGEAAQPVLRVFEALSKAFFGMIGLVMKLAPLGAGSAMAFTVGKYGVHSLAPLLKLMGSFYLTCLLFVLIVLGFVARIAGFSILFFLRYIRDELLVVLGTSSSEVALPPLMLKLERLGCSKQVVGLVIPIGYSFNLDGTNIYLTMAALFVAQALNIDLTLPQQLAILAVAMLTSKGASGVTGAGFITLAATLMVVPSVPVAGLALILGIDRFMSEARALTNIIGNGVATIVIARWEGALDRPRLGAELSTGSQAMLLVEPSAG